MAKLFLLLLLTLNIACTQNPKNAQTKLGPDEFEHLLQQDNNVQLVDVRTPEEFQGGHIFHAQNLNFYDADFEQKIAKLDKTKPVAVYCAKGGRSASAAEKLQQAGFPKVFDLAGGMSAWKSAGKKTAQ